MTFYFYGMSYEPGYWSSHARVCVWALMDSNTIICSARCRSPDQSTLESSFGYNNNVIYDVVSIDFGSAGSRRAGPRKAQDRGLCMWGVVARAPWHALPGAAVQALHPRALGLWLQQARVRPCRVHAPLVESQLIRARLGSWPPALCSKCWRTRSPTHTVPRSMIVTT